MNKSAFLKLIQQVSNISDQQTEELEKVAAAFPYCQTAHLLLAKSAYDKGSMLSTQRLRRASSYATDRQLLKRVIYTSPLPEPEFEESTTQVSVEEEETPVSIATDEVTNVVELTLAVQEENETPAEENLDEVYASASFAEDDSGIAQTATWQEEEPEEKLDSELALLFTFNSISTSSTDLLSNRNYTEEQSEDEALDTDFADHLRETSEALSELDSDGVSQEFISEEDKAVGAYYTSEQHPSSEKASEYVEEETEIFEEEEEKGADTFPEEAEINYTVDEIDRLYAEDALGYWMGSSRMGEVLQLKDDYTRERPQSFHPELILEYSKTHELEKAIQPTANVLSNQIDIIDQFLKLNPRLKTMANLKLKPEPQEDLSIRSSKIKKGMASESLANIFLKQGKTKKAVKIYEQLILKYPEKKSYFAEQIEKLQNIT